MLRFVTWLLDGDGDSDGRRSCDCSSCSGSSCCTSNAADDSDNDDARDMAAPRPARLASLAASPRTLLPDDADAHTATAALRPVDVVTMYLESVEPAAIELVPCTPRSHEAASDDDDDDDNSVTRRRNTARADDAPRRCLAAASFAATPRSDSDDEDDKATLTTARPPRNTAHSGSNSSGGPSASVARSSSDGDSRHNGGDEDAGKAHAASLAQLQRAWHDTLRRDARVDMTTTAMTAATACRAQTLVTIDVVDDTSCA